MLTLQYTITIRDQLSVTVAHYIPATEDSASLLPHSVRASSDPNVGYWGTLLIVHGFRQLSSVTGLLRVTDALYVV
jgi:hypothetical protein